MFAFQALGEAYRVLGDPAARAAYDRSALVSAKARPDPATARTTPPYAPRCCQECGRLTAQPRHVVFPTVRGRLKRSEIGALAGVFCRRCADSVGLRAAWHTWRLGWWSLPWGPAHSLRALWVVLAGGHHPRPENHALLLHQARAFLLRGDEDVARGLAQHALAFADHEGERRLARGIIAAIPAEGRRQLRNPWPRPSLRRLLPAAPLVAAVVAVGVVADVSRTPGAPPPTAAAPISAPHLPTVSGIPGLSTPFLLRNGHLYEVMLPGLPLRDGPGPAFPVLAELDAGSVVMVSDNTFGGGWVRVFVGSGPEGDDLSGYVSARYLMPSLPKRGLDGQLRQP